MKNITLVFSLLIFNLLFLGCQKETSIKGRVLENNTLKPIANIPVKLYDKSWSDFKQDSTITDKNGEYFFADVIGNCADLLVKISPKEFYYSFNVDNPVWVGPNIKNSCLTFGEENVIDIIINPIGAIKVNFRNVNPVNDNDLISYSIKGDNDFDLTGQLKGRSIDTSIKYIPFFYSNKNVNITYTFEKNRIISDTFRKSIFCKGRDTTYLSINF